MSGEENKTCLPFFIAFFVCGKSISVGTLYRKVLRYNNKCRLKKAVSLRPLVFKFIWLHLYIA